jgi:hypothetical protein
MRFVSLILSVFMPAQAFSLRRRANESISWLCVSIQSEFDHASNDVFIRKLNSTFMEIPVCQPSFRLWFWQQPKAVDIEKLNRIDWLLRMRVGILKFEEKKRRDLELKLKWKCEVIKYTLNSWSNDIVLGHWNSLLQESPLCKPFISLKQLISKELDMLKSLQWFCDMKISILKNLKKKAAEESIKFGLQRLKEEAFKRDLRTPSKLLLQPRLLDLFFYGRRLTMNSN